MFVALSVIALATLGGLNGLPADGIRCGVNPWYRPAMGDEESLETLMSRYVAGAPDAFDLLYSRTSQRVFAFQMVMTGDRNRAEDLCQTTFLKLHRAREGYMEGAPVIPWLMAIARNVFLDDARKRTRARVRITSSGDVPDVVDPKSAQPPPSGLKEAIDRAVDALSPLQREAFVLTKHSGLSPRDAARVLGTSETAVKLRVHRAYLALRLALAPYRSGDA
jgi:RNA polymerase sigma-70 factor (ECF subfamily)